MSPARSCASGCMLPASTARSHHTASAPRQRRGIAVELRLPAGQFYVKLALQRSHAALARGDFFDDDLETPKYLLKWLAHLCMDDSAVDSQ